MSFFGKLFSGKKGEPAPTPSEAIQKLRDIENMLTKKQEFLEKKIEVEIDTARKNGTKNKRGMLPEMRTRGVRFVHVCACAGGGCLVGGGRYCPLLDES